MSCSRTFANLRMFHQDVDPESISSRLRIKPTRSFRAGDPGAKGAAEHRHSGWVLSTESLSSVDIRVHVDLLLEQLGPVESVLADLRHEGVKQDVFCYWATKDGQGGPQLEPAQMGRLSMLGLPIYFDVYRV